MAVAERRGPQLDDPGRTLGATGDGRDHRHLVTVRDDGRGIRVLPVPGEAHRRPARSEDGEPRGEGRPDSLHVRSLGQIELHLARTRQLALDGEQSHPDPDRHGCHDASGSAAPRGDEQSVPERQDRRGEARIGEDCRIERTQCRRVRVAGLDRPGAGHAAAPQHVVRDDESTRREPPDERLEIRLVFGLQRIDEDEVERASEGRVRPWRGESCPGRVR